MHQEYTYPMLPMEIAAVRNGVAPIPSAERLMLTVLRLDEKRAELEIRLSVLERDYARVCLSKIRYSAEDIDAVLNEAGFPTSESE